MYNFDEVIDTNSSKMMKWNKDMVEEMYDFDMTDDTIYMWISDMDFPCPKPIITAVEERAKAGDFGYIAYSKESKEALTNWYDKRHNMKIQKDWIVFVTRTINGIEKYINCFTKENEGIIIQTPVYGLFARTIKRTNRCVVENPLIMENGEYSIDFEGFEKLCKDEGNTGFIFCNPHNPIGRVWPEQDIKKLIDICQRNNVTIFADEIHGDIVRENIKFVPMMNCSDYKGLITAVGINKTFNTAGLHGTNLIIPNDETRAKFKNYTGVIVPTIFSNAAIYSAYAECEDWCKELNLYIDENFIFLENYLKENMKDVGFVKSEGTYFAWLDFRKYNLFGNDLVNKIGKDARVIVENGTDFGANGEGFVRINVATSISIIKHAFKRINEAFK